MFVFLNTIKAVERQSLIDLLEFDPVTAQYLLSYRLPPTPTLYIIKQLKCNHCPVKSMPLEEVKHRVL